MNPPQSAFSRDHSELAIFEPAQGTLVVIPSLTLPADELRKIKGVRLYEERLLFLLLTLRNPQVRVVYISSTEVHPEIVDYYLGFLPDPADARRRLRMIPLGRTDDAPLTCKVLDNPGLCREIGALARQDAWLLPFVVSTHEERLAEITGLPVYGPATAFERFGTKSGGREIAAEAGVACSPGAGDLSKIGDVEEVTRRLIGHGPVMLKLNDSYSGLGNAVVEQLPDGIPLSQAPIKFSAPDETWDSFAAKLTERGGIAERFLTAPDLCMPSVLARITPGGRPIVVATHDQILDGYVYQGCRFPARADYRFAVQESAERIMRVMAAHGVIGLFGMDFFVTRRKVMLCEINLRLGGTTHPFGTALLATGGTYDHGTGHLVAGGQAKSYMTTDNLIVPGLRGHSPAEVIAGLGAAAFDARSRTGSILHLLGAATAHGKVGFTAVGDSPAGAQAIYDATCATLTAAFDR